MQATVYVNHVWITNVQWWMCIPSWTKQMKVYCINGMLLITNYMFRSSGGHHQVFNKFFKRKKQAKLQFLWCWDLRPSYVLEWHKFNLELLNPNFAISENSRPRREKLGFNNSRLNLCHSSMYDGLRSQHQRKCNLACFFLFKTLLKTWWWPPDGRNM
jgi:hypothetical protein